MPEEALKNAQASLDNDINELMPVFYGKQTLDECRQEYGLA